MNTATDSEPKRKSSAALFFEGFFNFIHPFYINTPPPKLESKLKLENKLKCDEIKIESPDISRYFEKLGLMLTNAYEREAERLGIKIEYE